MKILDKSELLTIYNELCASIKAEPLLSQCQEAAGKQINTYMASYKQSDQRLKIAGDNFWAASIEPADVMSYAVWFAWKNCPPCNCLDEHRVTTASMELTLAYLDKVARFAYCHDLILMSIANHANAHLDGKEITIELAKRTNKQIQVADQYLAHARGGYEPNHVSLSAQLAGMVGAPVVCIDSELSYNLDFKKVLEIATMFEKMAASRHNFGHVKFGRSYTMPQVKQVCSVLEALVFYHSFTIRPFVTSHYDSFIASVSIEKSLADWVRLLEEITGFTSEVVREILDDLSFRSDLYKRVDDAPFPPFLPTKRGLLLMAGALIGFLSEEHLYRLLAVIAPEVHGNLKQTKEGTQLGRLRSLFEGRDVQVLGPFKKVVYGSRSTDLDAIVIQKSKNLAWCCQLKWPAHARWRKNFESVEDDLNKAMEQTEISLGWLSSHPQAVITELKMTKEQFASLRFYGLVISSGPLGGGLAEVRTDIPVTNEFVIESLLNKQGTETDIGAVWTQAKTAFLPTEGVDFIFEDLSLELYHYKFRAKEILIVSSSR